MLDTLLILNFDPALEEDLVDYLHELECVPGFTTYPVRGHGQHGSKLSLAEQVTGRRKRMQTEIIIEAGNVDTVLQDLGSRVGRDITWWTVPVSRHGRA